MAIFADIQNGLASKLNELNDLIVDWENTKYKGNEGKVRIHPQLASAQSTLRDTSGTQENPGFLQIDVYVPLGSGTKSLTSVIDNIYDLFKNQILEVGSTKIYIRQISRGPSYRSDSCYVGVVDVYYTCYD